MIPTTKRQWLVPMFIGLAVATLFFAGAKYDTQQAVAQYQGGPDGQVMVIPIQLERDMYGIAMVDVNRQALWIYQLNNRGPVYNRLKLFAARSWKYDRLLEQYNTAEPKPEQVKALLNTMGQQILEVPEEKADVNSPAKEIETNENK